MNECCLEHSGHASRIEGLEEDHKETLHNANSAHRRIDGMKNWVIAGMASLIMQLLTTGIGFAVLYVKSKAGG